MGLQRGGGREGQASRVPLVNRARSLPLTLLSSFDDDWHMPRRALSNVQLALLVLATFMLGALAGLQYAPSLEEQQLPAEKGGVHMVVPAVDENGKGVPTDLRVDVRDGDGKVLANIDQLLFITDTQQSIQVARDVAANITKRDTRNVDIIYSVTTPPNVTLVGGPSAGAALTIATIAALQGKQLKEGVSITGTINLNGTIGEVGGVTEKAKAAKARGISLFLVPVGESTETLVKPVERCHEESGYTYCETVYERSTINVGSTIGLDVREIRNIREAEPYFGL